MFPIIYYIFVQEQKCKYLEQVELSGGNEISVK